METQSKIIFIKYLQRLLLTTPRSKRLNFVPNLSMLSVPKSRDSCLQHPFIWAMKQLVQIEIFMDHFYTKMQNKSKFRLDLENCFRPQKQGFLSAASFHLTDEAGVPDASYIFSSVLQSFSGPPHCWNWQKCAVCLQF